LNRKLSIILAACAAFIIASTGLAVYYASVVGDKDNQISSLQAELASYKAEVNTLNATIQNLSNQITQKNDVIAQKNNEIITLNNQVTTLTNQIADLNNQIDNLNNQIANKPRIVVDGLAVEDDRGNSPYNLHIYGRINNTGGGTAYNAFLHIEAFNAEGVAIDTYHGFGGITGKMSLGLDFRVNYTGSPIENWFITPIYTDEPIIPYSGTFTP
jgi:cell division protein FtsB